jgi:hypothetical protein
MMTFEAPSSSASPPSETFQPGAIVTSEADSADLRKDMTRRVLLRFWHRLRLGGPMRRLY